MPPSFSIVIPMYNRERSIARTINSCLNQTFEDFEIVVVDDGSTDGSAGVVQSIKDPRVRLIRNQTNQERLIGRNNGARASKGEWIIWLDSDDELVPGALAVMKRRISELPSDVLVLHFMCRLDSGRVSPDPPLRDEIWDYEGYIRWYELHHEKWSEYLTVVNRQTIGSVLFSEDAFYTTEIEYHLDLASKFKGKDCADVLRLYHLDAENNDQPTWNPDIGRMLRAASVCAARGESVMSIHGRFLAKWAPQTFGLFHSGQITQLLLSGQKKKAWSYFKETLHMRTLSIRTLVIIILGMINPKLLAYARAIHAKTTSLRTKS